MLVDKIPWVSHGGAGTPLYSLDIHPNGSRLATSGSDHKVKIWRLAAVLNVKAEASSKTSRLLATLADHGGPVNVIRFSHSGRFLATASDDKVIAVLELKGGQAQASFGNSDGPNIENWKVVLTLRGHSAGIPDLNWSPDDSLLASCSLDNLVLVWDTVTGQLLHTLSRHTSFVKGVAWDPVNRYLASQSDDRSVIIWDRTTWAPVTQITKPFSKGFVSSTFSLRIGWSPDGSKFACVNSFQSPCHVAPLIERGTWLANKQNLVGHSHAVVVARFNPKLFYKNAEEVSSCIAIGSQDAKLTIWVLHQTRPICIGTKFFERSVVDLAWTPDGYTLLASSMDGTVAAFSFTESELGKAVSDEDLEKTKKELHGAHASHALRFAESAEQQHMEIDADTPIHVLPSPGLLSSGNNALAGRLAPEHGVPSDLQPGPSQQAQVDKRRISPNSIGSVPTGTHVNSAASAKSRPPIPTRPPKPPSSLPNGSAAGPGATAGSKRKASELPMPAPARRRITPESLPAPTGQPGSGQPAGAPPPPPPSQPAITFQQEPQLHAELGKEPIPLGDQAEGGSRVLEAVLRSGQWEIVCHSSGLHQWTDQVPAKVMAVAGSLNFAAAAFESAVLQVYTPAGRRMLPALKLSAPPVSLSSDGAWRLMVVCRDGSLRVWDLHALTVQLEVCLLPLVAATPAGTAVRQVQLSKDGAVHALLSNRSAWLYHTGLACWLCLADSAFAASPFTSLLPLNPALQGDLGRIQQQASSSGRGLPPGALLTSTGSLRTGLGQGRGHLEANMAAALALQSPQEYKRWLSTYASHLAGEGDEVRLRELCIELLGNGQHSSSDQAMDTGWSPTVCGLDKRRLLQDEVLKRSGDKHQSIRRIKAEMFDLLSSLQESSPTAPI